jgi:predicted dehydrogenase
MGGFAQDHHRAVRALEREEECRLVCACDPRMDAFSDRRKELEFDRRGVGVFEDYREMLDAHGEGLDLATIPTPVPLHAPMHRACAERNLGVYLEKPPTLYEPELDEMIEAESSASSLAQVGFNFIAEDSRQALKRRILNGEFGMVRRVRFLGLWPRPRAYFTRSDWAARLMLDGKIVLDSCIGNAMAHYLHNLLFWAGLDDLYHWAEPIRLKAELARAHRIQGMDTVFALGDCEGGVEIQVAATHACDGPHRHYERVDCERATLTYLTYDRYRIEWKDGKVEEGPVDRDVLLVKNFRRYFGYLRGEFERPFTTLRDSRPFVRFNDLMYLAARRIATVPESEAAVTADASGEWVAIPGIEDACEAFMEEDRFPSDQGAPWSAPGGEATPSDLPELASVIRSLCE